MTIFSNGSLHFIFDFTIGVLGFFLCGIRLRKLYWPRKSFVTNGKLSQQPLVSIIIPARNEESNICLLLDSLMKLKYSRTEIIVIDDGSTDRTGELVAKYPVKLLKSSHLPPGWTGKNWACHQGAAEAKGELILFTDADTVHFPDSLNYAVSFLLENEAKLISALPFHDSQSLWEKFMAPMHLLILVISRALSDTPQKDSLFAIGQYLLFRKDHYEQCGHKHVHTKPGEDMALARETLKMGEKYQVYQRADLFKVRMYPKLSNFIEGWRRHFSVAGREFSFRIFVEMLVMIVALNPMFSPYFLYLWPMTLGMLILFAQSQKAIGRFSYLGIIFYHLSLMTMLGTMILSLLDRLMGRPVMWKGRGCQLSPPKGP